MNISLGRISRLISGTIGHAASLRQARPIQCRRFGDSVGIGMYNYL